MATSRPIILGLLALIAFLGLRAEVGGTASAPRVGPPALTGTVKHAGLRFGSNVALRDRQVVLSAIANARPEARRLVGLVDGLVTVDVGSLRAGAPDAIGVTRGGPDGFQMTLDLGDASEAAGLRGIERLVLHEFGHVVDSAIVPPALERALIAEIPAGYGCDNNLPTGACAPLRERFAETFAKWATGDIGLNVPLGYKVLPPDSLEDWGAQLVRGIRSS
jgi:hypothetical protein